MDNQEKAQDDVVVIETPPVEVGSSAKGQYKYQIRDDNGVVYDSGDWKPNLILDCGLDKLADMPWAQTFQWAVVGTDPTPTVDKYEDTQLTVSLELNDDCGNINPEVDQACFEQPPLALIAKATGGCRRAPLLPEFFDLIDKKMVPQVPEVALNEARTFGKFTDIGKTLYLRDRNLQFKVLSSCPEYTVDPIQIELQATPVSGSCSGLSALDSGAITLKMTEDGDIDPAFIDIDDPRRGIGAFTAGQGYLSGDQQGMTIGMGNPNYPILDANGNLNPASGIKVTAPTGRAARGTCEIKGNPCTTGVHQTDITVTDGGEGYGFMDCGGSIAVTFQAPNYDAQTGPWNYHWKHWNGRANTISGPGQSYGIAGQTRLQNSQYSYYPRLVQTLDKANWERVFGSSDVAGDKNEEKDFQGVTAYVGTSGYNDANLNVCMAQVMFLNLMDHGQSVSGINRGDASRGYHSGAGQYYPSGVNLATFNYTAYGLNTSYVGAIPAHGRTIKTNIDNLGDNVAVGATTLRQGTDALYAETSSTHAIAYTYHGRNMRGSHNLPDVVSPLDPVNNFFVWRHSDGVMMGSVPMIHKYPEAVRRNSQTNAGGQLDYAGNGLDQVFATNSEDPSAFVDEIKAGGISQIDLEKAYEALEQKPVDFYLPVCGAKSSIKNWQFSDPTRNSGGSFAGTIVSNSELLKGVHSIGQGDPDTLYGVPTKATSSGNETVADEFAYLSYEFSDADATNSINDMNSAQINQQGWTYNGSWNVEDGPGPKGVSCGKGRSMSQISDGIQVLTNDVGAISVIRIWPKRLLKPLLQNCRNDGHIRSQRVRQVVDHYNSDQQSRAIYRMHTIPWEIPSVDNFLALPSRRAAKGVVNIDKCRVSSVTLTEPGIGYRVGDKPWVKFSQPETRPAKIQVHTNQTGTISAIDVLDGGAGYSCVNPATFTFPAPPPQRVRSYNLQVKPVNTYENINNNYFFKTGSTTDGTADRVGLDDLQNERCDIYNTEQTYLGQGKSHFDQGQRTTASQGGYEGAPDRYGPCHFVNHGENVAGEVVTHNQYKTHGWYVTGVEHETNSQYCGTAFLSAANQMSLVRTYDFYMELQPVTYTEIGFKESPAARELFSRIVFDDPIRLRAGQYLRIAYQLLVTMEPGASGRYKEVPSEGSWYNGSRTWTDENILDGEPGHETTVNVLTGYECIQRNGMCVVDERGIAIPYDISGVANEPYSPGSYLLGPQYGYVNRWKNGDTRLSFPTREYKNDENNPWILGGDQMNPPDWAIKYFDSPTVNYRPRDFKSYLEWPAYETSIPYYQSSNSSTLNWRTKKFYAGPESTLERDAFAHWFTPTFPNKSGSITWTNFVNNAANNGNINNGRWDYHTTKAYVREVYPHLVREPHVYGITVNDAWYEKYRKGGLLARTSMADHRSGKGIFMEPVIEYDGDPGGLHDPTTISTVRKNPKSATGGMGQISRATYRAHNPYTGKEIYMVRPHNNLYTGSGVDVVLGSLSMNCVGGPYSWGSTTAQEWCYPTRHHPITDDGVFGPHGLTTRRTDLRMTSLRTTTYLSNDYGGGFTTLDSWKPWTHTPHIENKAGTVPSAVNPDTSGNWSQAEAIPVAGASAWISTNRDDFEECGMAKNRGHTLFGAVCGHMPLLIEEYYRNSTNAQVPEASDARYAKNDVSWSFEGAQAGKVYHDFDCKVSDLLRDPNAGAALCGYFDIDPKDLVTSEYGTTSSRAFETPTYLNDYKRGDHKRYKYAEWETSFGNLTAISSIGLGPTSTTLRPNDMTDAARFNTYVFKFGEFNVDKDDNMYPDGSVSQIGSGIPFGQTSQAARTINGVPTMVDVGPNSFNNLSTYKLKATFQFTWYRDLS